MCSFFSFFFVWPLAAVWTTMIDFLFYFIFWKLRKVGVAIRLGPDCSDSTAPWLDMLLLDDDGAAAEQQQQHTTKKKCSKCSLHSNKKYW